jgi:hypothetical protein
MQSTTRTTPASVVNVVSRTSVPSRYWRWTLRGEAAGASFQRPWSRTPSRRAKHAGESKQGRQSQSIEPVRETSAALSVSPMSA